MKSIVLYERTLVQESEDFQNLKEDKLTEEEGNEKTEEKKNVNGTCGSNSLETPTSNPEEDDMVILNGVEKPAPKEKEENGDVCEIEHDALGESKNECATTNSGVVPEKSGDCANEVGEDKSRSEMSKNVGAEGVEHLYSNETLNFSSDNNETSDDAIEIIDEDEEEEAREEPSDNVLKNTDTNVLKERFDAGEGTEKESFDCKESKQEEQTMEELNSDVDENKENEKTCKVDSSGGLLSESTNECEIQVGEVQTITGSEKDSMWTENDLQKMTEEGKDKLDEKFTEDCQDVVMTNDESIHIDEEVKDDEPVGDESGVVESNESFENAMQIELEEPEVVEEMKMDEKESEGVESNVETVNKEVIKKENTNSIKTSDACSRKRQMSEVESKTVVAKKKKLSESSEDQETKVDSSPSKSFPSLETTGVSEGRLSSASDADQVTQKPSIRKSSRLAKASEISEEKKIEKAQTVYSVLEKFRGSLKTLTRSDLEELIVQKLCEVITERSNVGELRRKAAALEQDQERWKTKVQSLTKQIREMEMVMKKYMSEVQKQTKEGENQVVTPIKVTRSVGLQVSFYSGSNKQLKQNIVQSPSPNVRQKMNVRNRKESLTKPPQVAPAPPATATAAAAQYNSGSPNAKNKVAPPPPYPGTPIPKPPVNQRRRVIAPKPDAVPGLPNRNVAQQPSPGNNRGGQNQAPGRGNFKQVPGSVNHPPHNMKQQQKQQQQKQQPQQNQKQPQQKQQNQQQQQQKQQHHPPQLQQQQQQQQQHLQTLLQQQNGSKVIDLTDDDDRQTATPVKNGPIRVVSNLTQPPPPPNNRFAYLLPTTSATTASAMGQGRQVLIATPTVPQPNSRQIMCSMPPLLFKGGNVQSGSQSQIISQSSKFILPKPLRHPAPLPQRPIYQNHRPSLKLIPPRPALKISKVQTGIVLSWNMSLSPDHAPISSYQLYAYQESDQPPSTSLWKKVGDVKALPLPMACTLTQFMSGHKYHFAVRAVDLHSRIGPFSFPGTIVLV